MINRKSLVPQILNLIEDGESEIDAINTVVIEAQQNDAQIEQIVNEVRSERQAEGERIDAHFSKVDQFEKYGK